MGQTNHTPGSWDACEPGDYLDYDGNCIVILGSDIRICVVLGVSDESKATAQLIAASPDLATALRLVASKTVLTSGIRAVVDAALGKAGYSAPVQLIPCATSPSLELIDEQPAVSRPMQRPCREADSRLRARLRRLRQSERARERNGIAD
ncbi:hypothetical protein [Burkholderia pyrrocinia]|uniref:hypothetical protein n=1 Tax=Burkholderia pyrrocinia TaxID=60550 RepID=UPI001FC86BBA|nr:hypothetical protein [Burkholderia pyrrocinia]